MGEERLVEIERALGYYELRGTQHAALLDRVVYLESRVVDSEKWEKLDATHASMIKLQNDVDHRIAANHVSIEGRLAYIERVFGDFADKHAKWESAYCDIAKLK